VTAQEVIKRLHDDGWYEVRQSGSPLTRLLDLLAGWSAYVSEDEESDLPDPALSAGDIGALYQVAGAGSEIWQELSDEDQEKAVKAFVNERIVPLLIRGR